MYWANMQVFDYKGRLVTGNQSLGVWKFSERQNPTIYPQGTPGKIEQIYPIIGILSSVKLYLITLYLYFHCKSLNDFLQLHRYS